MSKHITTRAAKTIIATIISASCLGAVAIPTIAVTSAHAATISAASPADGTTPTTPSTPDNEPWG